MEYITTSNLYWEGFKLDGLKKMPFIDNEIERCQAVKGDLLVCEGGDIGRACIWPYENAIMLQNHIHKLRAILPLCTKYFYYIFYLYNQTGIIGGKGIGIQGFSSRALHNTIVPFPPLNEQFRIANRMDGLLPIVEKYNRTQVKLDALNESIKEKLQKSILQEAIQGRLVPQIPEEGTTQELLAQIKQEKIQLVKEGKLKKTALQDSVIFKGGDNRYYEQVNGQTTQIECDCEFPVSWSVVRLSAICSLIDGAKAEGKLVCLDAKYLRGKSAGEYMQKGRYVQKGNNIILVDGENSGEVFTVPCDGYMGSTFKQLWVSSAMYMPYVLNNILFYKELLRQSKRGAAIPHLNKEVFYSLIIGIPPYKEQKRIAEQIDYLLKFLK